MEKQIWILISVHFNNLNVRNSARENVLAKWNVTSFISYSRMRERVKSIESCISSCLSHNFEMLWGSSSVNCGVFVASFLKENTSLPGWCSYLEESNYEIRDTDLMYQREILRRHIKRN